MELIPLEAKHYKLHRLGKHKYVMAEKRNQMIRDLAAATQQQREERTGKQSSHKTNRRRMRSSVRGSRMMSRQMPPPGILKMLSTQRGISIRCACASSHNQPLPRGRG